MKIMKPNIGIYPLSILFAAVLVSPRPVNAQSATYAAIINYTTNKDTLTIPTDYKDNTHYDGTTTNPDGTSEKIDFFDDGTTVTITDTIYNPDGSIKSQTANTITPPVAPAAPTQAPFEAPYAEVLFPLGTVLALGAMRKVRNSKKE